MKRIGRIKELRIRFKAPGGTVLGTDGLSLELRAGEILGLVGESGSGKSLSALALAGLLPPLAKAEGEVEVLGVDMLHSSEGDRKKLRGTRVGFVFQNPGASLTPWVRIGVQMSESLRGGLKLSHEDAEARLMKLLPKLKLPAERSFLRKYPHELSGGMRQRAALAAAVAPDPELLIADEPTTALDVVTQAEVLEVLKACAGPRRAVLLITHDLLVAAKACSRIAVAYAGRIVEEGPVESMLKRPQHPYTLALLAAARKDAVKGRLQAIPGAPAAPGSVGGCPFHPRCPKVMSRCRTEAPVMEKKGKTQSACFLE